MVTDLFPATLLETGKTEAVLIPLVSPISPNNLLIHILHSILHFHVPQVVDQRVQHGFVMMM